MRPNTIRVTYYALQRQDGKFFRCMPYPKCEEDCFVDDPSEASRYSSMRVAAGMGFQAMRAQENAKPLRWGEQRFHREGMAKCTPVLVNTESEWTDEPPPKPTPNTLGEQPA